MARPGESMTSAARRPPQRARIAYHEAGHAVIARTFGRAIRHAALGVRGRYDGHVMFVMPKRPYAELRRGAAPWWRLRQEIMVSLAGPAAEALFSGRLDRRGGEDDFARARELAGHEALGAEETVALVEWLYVRTRTILQLPACWAQVTRVARVLVRDELLTGPEIDALMGERP